MAKKAASPGLNADCRVVLLAGSEQFLALEHTKALRDKLAERFGEVDVVRFDGTTASAAEVLDECRSFGLMQQHKLVVVDTADQLVKADNRPLLERYAANPASDATLVLRATKWNKGKLDDLIAAAGAIVPCEPPPPEKAAAWSVARCTKRHRATLDPQAAIALVERVGADLGRLDSELGKLAAIAAAAAADAGHASDHPVITPELVARFVGVSREEEVWGVQATLLMAPPAAALAHVRELLDVSKQPPTLLTYAMTDLARKVYGAAAALQQRTNEFETAKALKLWGPTRDAVLAAGRGVAPSAALALFDACVQSDLRQKTGLGAADRAVDLLALRFGHTFARRRTEARP